MRLFLLLLFILSSMARAEQPQIWLEAVRDGQAILLLRHAQAPGIGDPERFRLGDCTTQRNLDQRGREQAARWGDYLREQGIISVRLFSSRWCRAQETAEGMALGPVQALAALDSFFRTPDQRQQHIRELRAFLADLGPGEPLVMVSHQVNITALTGLFPQSAEALVIALPLGETVDVLARVSMPEP